MKSLPKNYILALIIFIGVLTWIASGFFKSETIDDSLEINNTETIEEKIAVRAKDIYGEDKTYFLTVRGRTEAEKRVLLRPKTSSTVIKTINKGSFVKKGDIICSLDPENRSARLIEAEAGKNQAQLQYDAVKELFNEGYRSENALATAEAVLKGAIAREQIARNELSNIAINAPFDGFIEDVMVEIGDLMTPASSCAVILQLNPMIVTGEVTEKNVSQVTKGEKILINFLNGDEIDGTLSYVSKSSSSSTRTYKIEASFKNESASIREGLTANIKIPLRNLKAHLVPSYLLSLDDDGNLGLKIINNGTVKFVLIEIIEDTTEGLWVTGLPLNTQIITVGQEYVIDGQQVNVQMVNN
jgi:multidrug efflux system membrane fusion protein